MKAKRLNPSFSLVILICVSLGTVASRGIAKEECSKALGRLSWKSVGKGALELAKGISKAPRRIHNLSQLGMGTAKANLSPDIKAIFDKMDQDRYFEPNEEERSRLKLARRDDLFGLYSGPSLFKQAIRGWNRMVGTWARSKPTTPSTVRASDLRKGFQDLVTLPADLYRTVVRKPFTESGDPTTTTARLGFWAHPLVAKPLNLAALTIKVPLKAIRDWAIPLPATFVNRRTRQLYDRILENPDYELLEPKFKLIGLPKLPSFPNPFRKTPPPPLLTAQDRVLENKAAMEEAWNAIRESHSQPLKAALGYSRYAVSRGLHEMKKWYSMTNDQKFVKKWNLQEPLDRYREDIRDPKTRELYQSLRSARSLLGFTKWAFILGGGGMALSMNDYISAEDSMDTFDPDDEEENPNKDRMSVNDDKVELIFLSPMPHVALRWHGLIYNYGQFQMDRYRLKDLKEGYNTNEDLVGFGKMLSGNHTRVELNLSPLQQDLLAEALEEDVKRVYPLVPPYNDCIAEMNKKIFKILGIKVPMVADRSQIGTLSTYKLMKAAGALNPETGKPFVGRITFASRGKRHLLHKGVDALSAMVDAAYFIPQTPSMMVVTPIWDRFLGTYQLPVKESNGPGAEEPAAESGLQRVLRALN